MTQSRLVLLTAMPVSNHITVASSKVPARGPDKAQQMRTRKRELCFLRREDALRQEEGSYLESMDFLAQAAGIGISGMMGSQGRHAKAWSSFQINRAAFTKVATVSQHFRQITWCLFGSELTSGLPFNNASVSSRSLVCVFLEPPLSPVAGIYP